MKSLIIFTTKYGCTEKAARLLQDCLPGEARTVNLMREKPPALDAFDTVILGGSIYMGRIQKELTAYMHKNAGILRQKKLGLFICAGQNDPMMVQKELADVFPTELAQHAAAISHFGGEFSFAKLSFLHRTIVRMVKGNKEGSSTISEEKIKAFAAELAK